MARHLFLLRPVHDVFKDEVTKSLMLYSVTGSIQGRVGTPTYSPSIVYTLAQFKRYNAEWLLLLLLFHPSETEIIQRY